MGSGAKPLPSNPYDAFSEKIWHDAYTQCLQIQPFNTDIIDKNLVYARILGYLILEAPADEGRDYICNEILTCKNNKSKLHDFAELFMLTVNSICELVQSTYI